MTGIEGAKSITLRAGAAVTQGRFVKMSSAGKVIHAAAAGDDVVGVALETRVTQDITDGKDAIAVAPLDGAILDMEAGAAVDPTSAAVPITSDSVGRAVAVAAATDRIHGYALSIAGAAGVHLDVLCSKGSDRRDA